MEIAVIFSYTAPATGQPAAALRRDTWQHNFAPRFGSNAVQELSQCIATHFPGAKISVEHRTPWD